MDEEDYRSLIEVVVEELERSGAADIADDGHLTRVDPETGDSELLRPLERLVEMLRAFEHLVAIHDRTLLHDFLETIQQALRGEGPRRLVVELADDGGPREVDLADAPDLAAVRGDVKVLVNRLLEDGFRRGDDL